MSKLSLILILSLISAPALACRIGDRVISHRVDYERDACTTSGYCTAYGYNSKTMRYETFYGYHSRCPGERQRTVDHYYCEGKDGYRYRDQKDGFWSYCRTK